MSAAACARAASDLTALVNRLQRARRSLDRQARLPSDDFGGLSGDAYRRHADRSALTVAELASGVALLAGALAALGRELGVAEQHRRQGSRTRADDVEAQAQQQWREAVARFDGRPAPAQVGGQPVVTGPALEPETTPPPPAEPSPAPMSAASTTSAASATAPFPEAAEPTLTAALVVPPPLEAELVTPPRPHRP